MIHPMVLQLRFTRIEAFKLSDLFNHITLPPLADSL